MNNKTEKTKHAKELYKLFLMPKSENEVEALLNDIFTPQELEKLAERWQLVRLLDQGVPQREIASCLGVSISKITRGSNVLQYGTGALKKFLSRWR